MWSFIICNTHQVQARLLAYTPNTRQMKHTTSILKVEKQRPFWRSRLKKRFFVPLTTLIVLNCLEQHSFRGTPKYENKLRRYIREGLSLKSPLFPLLVLFHDEARVISRVALVKSLVATQWPWARHFPVTSLLQTNLLLSNLFLSNSDRHHRLPLNQRSVFLYYYGLT